MRHWYPAPSGSAAGQNVEHVDPLDQPGRFHEERESLPDAVRSLIQQRETAAGGAE